MDINNLISVAAGGIIGFMAAFGMEALKRSWSKKDNKEKVSRLLELLYEEVEQLAELLDIDLGIVENNDLDSILDFGRDTEHDGKLKSTISRLQNNRTIYESQANKLLELPGYLPNSLVRFYSRLQVNCSKMYESISDNNLEQLQNIRSQSLIEAVALKNDLNDAKQQFKNT